jgi:prepilin-type N-terminal cleavage/methylation domain-containing protein
MSSEVLRPGNPFSARLREERGFGMIELLAAMTIMLIGIFAVYAVFQAGIVQIRRASTITTAAAIGDAQMEKFRAIRFDSIGLADTDVAAADATYKADTSLYKADISPSTTVASAMTASQLTVPVASAAGFPSTSPYIIQIDNELILVSGGTGTTTWTVRDPVSGQPSQGRGYLGTTATTHAAGATVIQKQRVNVTACGTAPCTNAVPTKTVTGADGRAYRVDTYVTWKQIGNSASTTGRLLKLVTIIVRNNASPYRKWARVDSSFDESTGV